jgi:hypothetical protein
MAELAKRSLVHPKDPGSYLGIERKKISFSVCVTFELKSVGFGLLIIIDQ